MQIRGEVVGDVTVVVRGRAPASLSTTGRQRERYPLIVGALESSHLSEEDPLDEGGQRRLSV